MPEDVKIITLYVILFNGPDVYRHLIVGPYYTQREAFDDLQKAGGQGAVMPMSPPISDEEDARRKPPSRMKKLQLG